MRALPVVDCCDAGRGVRMPILLVVRMAGMDDLRLDKHQWEDVVLIRDILGAHCLVLDCKHCLSQMVFLAVARTENLDMDSCQPVRIELMDRVVHCPPEDTLYVVEVLWMMKTVAVGRPVVLNGGKAVHSRHTAEQVKDPDSRVCITEVQIYGHPCRELDVADNTARSG